MAKSDESRTLVHSSPVQQLAVYRVQDESGQHRCLREHTFSSNTDCQQEVERFHLMQRLSHPSICQVLRVEETKVAAGWLLTVEMEWCGQDLESLTRSQYPQGWDENHAAQVLMNVLAALTYAQEQGVCHRDVKPSNLYETLTGYKVADFGSAKSLDSSLMSHTMAGTPLFLTPVLRRAFSQALLGEDSSHVEHNPFKSDVYSLGLTLVYLLQPSALSKLGNQTELGKVVSALPIHPSFSDTLRLMLAPEEADRPDFIGLTAHIQQLQAPAAVQEMQPPPQKEASAPASESIRRRVRVLKKPQSEPPVPAKPESPSCEELPLVPVQSRFCHACGQGFCLNLSDTWRLDLLGSPQSDTSKEYCSKACFQQASAPPHSDYQDADFSCPEPRSLTMVIISRNRENHFEQFLHCNRHIALLPDRANIIFRMTPTILAQCEECDPGVRTREELPQLDRWVEQNSLYPSLIFLGAPYQGRAAFFVFSIAALPTFEAATCHFCGRRVNPSVWLAFQHNHNMALVCSEYCMPKTPTCPTCTAPISYYLQGTFPERLGRFVTADDVSICSLCWCGESEYTLLCGHGFCKNCLSYIPEDSDMFSCLRCGQILLKSDYADLFGVRDSA